MIPDPDLARVVEVFDRHNVEYLIVGGSAATVYGATRATHDSDCLVARTLDNLKHLAAALKELNARLRVSNLSDEESAQLHVHIDAILEQSAISNWRTDAGDLDVMTDMIDHNGVLKQYEGLAGAAQVIDFNDILIRVASLSDIVASKESANRPKDHEALPELHRLLEQLSKPASSEKELDEGPSL